MIKSEITLKDWIFSIFKKMTVIPLIYAQIVFFILFWATIFWYQTSVTKSLQKDVNGRIVLVSEVHADAVSLKLKSVEYATKIFSSEVKDALKNEEYIAKSEDKKRLGFSKDGVYYTKYEKKPASMAVFYSGYSPIGPKEIRKVEKTFAVENHMISTVNSNPYAVSIYFNSFDSLNVIYPYFDVLSQYASKMNIPEFNFYYDADLKHNPKKEAVWTDAYLDPAGHGWMISSISPVYNDKSFLEGVVGIDITIDRITKAILNLDLPWDGYGVLVSRDGTILALPKQGEKDWNITELKNHNYETAVMQDTFKPEEFNIFKKNTDNPLITKIEKDEKGLIEMTLDGKRKFIAWKTIPETKWKLFIVVDREQVFADLNKTIRQIRIFEILLFVFLTAAQIYYILNVIKKSKKVSNEIALPLKYLETAFTEIEQGNFSVSLPKFDVTEIQSAGEKLTDMGKILGANIREREEAQNKLLEYQSSLENIVEERTKSLSDANDELESINQELKRLQGEIVQKEKLASIGKLSAGISHEINNPMAFINSNLNTITKYFAELVKYDKEISKLMLESDLENSEYTTKKYMSLRKNYQIEFILEDSQYIFEESAFGIKRISDIVNNLKNFSSIDDDFNVKVQCNINENLNTIFSLIKTEFEGSVNLVLDLQSKDKFYCIKTELSQSIVNILMNSVYSLKEKYIGEKGTLKITTYDTADNITLVIWDNGQGIPEEVIKSIFDPFFTTKPVGTGTGLGLYISYDVIVNKLHGTIKVISNFGEYTEFTITLPKILD